MKRCTKATLWVIGLASLAHAVLGPSKPRPELELVDAEDRIAWSCAFQQSDHVYEYAGKELMALVSVKRGTRFVLRIPKFRDAAPGELLLVYFPGATMWQTAVKDNPKQVEFIAGLLEHSLKLTPTAASFAGPTALESCLPPVFPRKLRLSNLA